MKPTRLGCDISDGDMSDNNQSSSCCSLLSDVMSQSEDTLPSLISVVPSGYEREDMCPIPGLITSCRCREKCWTRVDIDLVGRMRLGHFNRSPQQRSAFVFKLARSYLNDKDGKVGPQKRKQHYSIGSTNCGRRVWECAHGLKRDRVDEIMPFVRQGVEELRDKLPAVQLRCDLAYARQIADAWLLGFYHKLCMPEYSPASRVSGEGQSMYDHVIIDHAEHPLWGIMVGQNGSKRGDTITLDLGMSKNSTNAIVVRWALMRSLGPHCPMCGRPTGSSSSH